MGAIINVNLAHLSRRFKLSLSIVRHRGCIHRCCKLFSFSSSSQEPLVLGQFQLTLEKIVLGLRKFYLFFFQMKAHVSIQVEIVRK